MKSWRHLIIALTMPKEKIFFLLKKNIIIESLLSLLLYLLSNARKKCYLLEMFNMTFLNSVEYGIYKYIYTYIYIYIIYISRITVTAFYCPEELVRAGEMHRH